MAKNQHILEAGYRTIHEIIKEIGRGKTTFLRWEKEGKVPLAHRDDKGWRYYTEEECRRIIALVRETDYFRINLAGVNRELPAATFTSGLAVRSEPSRRTLFSKLRMWLFTFLLVFIWAGLFFAISAAVARGAAGVPKILSYQGRLTNASGDLLGGSGTTYYFRFSLYAASSGGSALWPSGTACTHSLNVKQGVFNAGIGDVSECSDVLDYDFTLRDAVYLQVHVASTSDGTFEALSPRQRINATAFAFVADTLISTSTQSRLGTTTPISGSLLTIEATSTSAIPLSIRGILGQVANLFQIQNAASTDLLTVTGTGAVGIATSSPGTGFSIATSTYIVGGLGIGVATTTANNFQLQGDAQITGALSLAGVLNVRGILRAGTGNVTLTDATGNILQDALVDCADNQILKWTTGSGWACGSDVTGGGSSSDLTYTVGAEGRYLTPTSTVVGLLTANTSSSTIMKLTSNLSTTTQATSTFLSVSSIASTTNLTVSNVSDLQGNVTLGSASGDTLTVNATTTFATGALFNNVGLALQGAAGDLSVADAATILGNVALGDNSADTLTVNATSTFSGGGVTVSAGGLSVTGAGGLSVTNAINTQSTITGTTLNGTTGINTGAGAGTNRIDVSGNLVNIGTITGTGLATLSGGILVNNATSTITNLSMLFSTSTQATTTYLTVSTFASTSALRVSNDATIQGAANITGNIDTAGTMQAGTGNVTLTDATGNVLLDSLVDCADTQILKFSGSSWGCASDNTGGGSSSDLTYTVGAEGRYLTPTSTVVGLLTANTSSSTIMKLTSNLSTTTQATSTFLSVSSIASTTNLTVSNVSDLQGNVTLGSASGDTLTVNATSTFSGGGVTVSAGGLSVTGAGGLSVTNAINTQSTITGTTLNGTTGINTGAGAGTNRIDVSGNLVNIGTITGTGLATLSGGILVNNATSTITNLSMLFSTSTQATTTYLTILTNASSSALTVSNASDLQGNVTLGSASGDTLTVNASTTFVNSVGFNGDIALGNAQGDNVTINSGIINFSNRATTTVVDLFPNVFSIATSTTNIPIFTVHTFLGTTIASGTSPGRIGIGTTTPEARLSIDSRTSNHGGIAGINEIIYISPTSGGTQYGNNTYIFQQPTSVANTLVGDIIRVEDNTALANTVRGLEVQAHRGTNTQGENTALSGFGRTFGVRAVTEGDAGGSFLPAAVFAQTRGQTQGNAIRAYSASITGEDLVYLFQETSAYATGTALRMNLGQGSGSFSANFLDLQVAGVSRLVASSSGTIGIGTSTPLRGDTWTGTANTHRGLHISSGAMTAGTTTPLVLVETTDAAASNKIFMTMRSDGNGASANPRVVFQTTGKLVLDDTAVTGPADVAEWYPAKDHRASLEPGDLVSIDGSSLVNMVKKSDGRPYDSAVMGIISTKPGLVVGGGSVEDSHENDVLVALVGRVPVKISTEGGPVKPGDRLTSSSIPGVAMKATSTGMTVGIALEAFDGTALYLSEGTVGVETQQITEEQISKVTKTVTQDNRKNRGGAEIGEKVDEEGPIEVTREELVSLSSTRDVAPENPPAQESAASNGKTVKIGKALMFVNLAWTKLDDGVGTLASASVLTDPTNAWSVNQISGKVNVGFYGDINLNGNNIYEVGSIAGMFGKWKIDESGKLVAEEIEAGRGTFKESLEVGTEAAPTGVTIYDSATGEPQCVRVAHGAVSVSAGKCGVNSSPTPSPSDVSSPAPSETPSAEPTPATEPTTGESTTPAEPASTETSPSTSIPTSEGVGTPTSSSTSVGATTEPTP